MGLIVVLRKNVSVLFGPMNRNGCSYTCSRSSIGCPKQEAPTNYDFIMRMLYILVMETMCQFSILSFLGYPRVCSATCQRGNTSQNDTFITGAIKPYS